MVGHDIFLLFAVKARRGSAAELHPCNETLPLDSKCHVQVFPFVHSNFLLFHSVWLHLSTIDSVRHLRRFKMPSVHHMTWVLLTGKSAMISIPSSAVAGDAGSLPSLLTLSFGADAEGATVTQ
ncbi:hypothetical protein Ancab_000519 [Ancistrocladus abbreviatus]